MKTMKTTVRRMALVLALMGSANGAHAQSPIADDARRQENRAVQASVLRLAQKWGRGAPSIVRPESRLLQQPPNECRRGRRAWIGALIGAGASVPVARFVHTRWENEAANGDAAAATTVAVAAAVGALIGAATCP